MIVTDEAFEELLDRALIVEGEGYEHEREERRMQFAIAVERAVNKAEAHDERRAWLTQSLRRHGCRLHFLRHGRDVFLVACMPIDDGQGDEA